MSHVGSDVGVRGSMEQEETGVPGEKTPAEAWVGDHLPSHIRPIADSEIRSRDLRDLCKPSTTCPTAIYILSPVCRSPRSNKYLRDETAAVCHASLDDGNVVLTRVFHGCEHDVHRAEDKVLNWLHHENYVKSCKNMFLTIIMDSSPLYTFSRNLMEFKLLLDEQEILNEVDLKFVRLCHMEDLEEDREENKEGMRLLHKAGVKLSSLTEKDWSFLREHLLDPNGLYEQEKNARRVTHELEEILKK
ncbi:hypothetical protein FSP39_006314 [Pinctada imbricata]|uniref:Uncharacterized protein n=1 Tax=Pinctada imbricata TaxID=66713 RepID=A0AA89C354_PINIB|nr:hypothetical protein FSP39_006314 [Pinctada imbricata]